MVGCSAQQVLRLAREQPASRSPELAKRLMIKPNYLYRIGPPAQGRKAREARKGYHPPEP